MTKSIDETDTAIIGNDTKLHLVKEIIPNIGSSLTYTINFSNQIHHPHAGHLGAITSTEFTILDGENISRSGCKFDDKDGVIRIFRIVDGNKKIVYDNQGTIDYDTGAITINSLSVLSVENIRGAASTKIELTVVPSSNDVVPVRDQILEIDTANSSITVTADTFVGGSADAGVGYTTTSSY